MRILRTFYSIARTPAMLDTPSSARADAKIQSQRVATHAQGKPILLSSSNLGLTTQQLNNAGHERTPAEQSIHFGSKDLRAFQSQKYFHPEDYAYSTHSNHNSIMTAS